MKFNTKIIISYAVIIAMPFILILIIGAASLGIQISSMNSKYGIDVDAYDCFFNQTHVLDQMTRPAYDDLMALSTEGEGRFKDTAALDEINAMLHERNSFLMVRELGGFYYADSELQKSKDYAPLFTFLDNFGISDNIGVTLYFSTADKSTDEYLIKSGKVTLDKKGTQGVFFVLTNVTNSLSDIKNLILTTVIVTIVATIIVGTLLTMWIYKSVISPLKKLNNAIRKVAMGDLDFSCKSTSTDEFGQLFNSFDKMRERLKTSIERQIASEEENKELISNISHDLKTPLTAIKGYCEGIIDGVADTQEKKDKYVKTIYNKANDMDKLIGELVLISKLESNSVPYNFSKLDINAYFSESIEEIRTELDSKDIKLAYINGLPEKVNVMADKEQLKRVINNIISNAVKYMDKEDKRIFIRIDEDEDDKKSIRVSIKDNGRGVKQEELDQLFKRFFRADSSRNSEQGGSGIGLAVVKKIIEDHGGRVWATGVEGQGLTMNFTLKKMTKDTL